MATTEWSNSFENSPAGPTSRKLGDDRIRELKLAIRERAQNGGHFMQDTVAAYVKDGRHVRAVGGGPHWYKSDATNILLEATSDILVTAKEGLTVNGPLIVTGGGSVDFSAVPVSSDDIAANAATKGMSLSPAFVNTTVAATLTSNFTGPTLTLGTPKGTILFFVDAVLEATADNDSVALNLQFDYLNTGVWTSVTTQLASGLWVPVRSSANHKRVTHGFNGIDPMTTPSNGGTVPSRIQLINSHATADCIVQHLHLTLLELRR